MKLANLLMERRIDMDLSSRTKDEAVHELLGMLRAEGVQFDYDRVIHSIRERETVENTAYGHGFAFPHARTDAVNELYILIGVSKPGLEDKAADGEPVHVGWISQYQ